MMLISPENNKMALKRVKAFLPLPSKLCLLTRAIGENSYVLMASIDLGAAFDEVNINLLIKCLRIIGLPEQAVT